MILRPKPGQPVRLHYAARWRALLPHHGRIGIVLAVGPGPGPRNVAVDLAGQTVVVPRGNLVPAAPRLQPQPSRKSLFPVARRPVNLGKLQPTSAIPIQQITDLEHPAYSAPKTPFQARHNG